MSDCADKNVLSTIEFELDSHAMKMLLFLFVFLIWYLSCYQLLGILLSALSKTVMRYDPIGANDDSPPVTTIFFSISVATLIGTLMVTDVYTSEDMRLVLAWISFGLTCISTLVLFFQVTRRNETLKQRLSTSYVKLRTLIPTRSGLGQSAISRITRTDAHPAASPPGPAASPVLPGPAASPVPPGSAASPAAATPVPPGSAASPAASPAAAPGAAPVAAPPVPPAPT